MRNGTTNSSLDAVANVQAAGEAAELAGQGDLALRAPPSIPPPSVATTPLQRNQVQPPTSHITPAAAPAGAMMPMPVHPSMPIGQIPFGLPSGQQTQFVPHSFLPPYTYMQQMSPHHYSTPHLSLYTHGVNPQGYMATYPYQNQAVHGPVGSFSQLQPPPPLYHPQHFRAAAPASHVAFTNQMQIMAGRPPSMMMPPTGVNQQLDSGAMMVPPPASMVLMPPPPPPPLANPPQVIKSLSLISIFFLSSWLLHVFQHMKMC